MWLPRFCIVCSHVMCTFTVLFPTGDNMNFSSETFSFIFPFHWTFSIAFDADKKSPLTAILASSTLLAYGFPEGRVVIAFLYFSLCSCFTWKKYSLNIGNLFAFQVLEKHRFILKLVSLKFTTFNWCIKQTDAPNSLYFLFPLLFAEYMRLA